VTMAVATEPVEAAESAATRPRWLLVVLALVSASALLAAGAALAVVTGLAGTRAPGETSVDAGFARDMSTHHAQAAEMAQVVRDHGADPTVRLLAYDIETQQLGQIGQLRGWLQTWGLTAESDVPAMAWMTGHEHGGVTPGGPMPGMATSAELDRLRSLSGRALDVYFLQLMIRHHRGGLGMASDAAEHASVPYVRDLAGRMAQAQQAEVVTMERLLRERGGRPLS
jgi:uncharacterized protein (DUF305 family)